MIIRQDELEASPAATEPLQSVIEKIGDRVKSTKELLTSREAPLNENSKMLECSDGNFIINGVRMPKWVVNEVRGNGINVEMLSPGDLHMILHAASDGHIFEDPHDHDEGLQGKLVLTQQEIYERREAAMPTSERPNPRAHILEKGADSHLERHENRASPDDTLVLGA